MRDGQILRPCALDFSNDDTVRVFQNADDIESYSQAFIFTESTKMLAKVHMFDRRISLNSIENAHR